MMLGLPLGWWLVSGLSTRPHPAVAPVWVGAHPVLSLQNAEKCWVFFLLSALSVTLTAPKTGLRRPGPCSSAMGQVCAAGTVQIPRRCSSWLPVGTRGSLLTRAHGISHLRGLNWPWDSSKNVYCVTKWCLAWDELLALGLLFNGCDSSWFLIDFSSVCSHCF